MKPPKVATGCAQQAVPDGRPAPAFQVYASDEMDDFAYRGLTLAECGLFTKLRNVLWRHISAPCDPAKVARIIGESAAEVTQLLPSIMPMFAVHGDQFFSPELERQRMRKSAELRRKSEGGKIGAATRSAAKNSGGDVQVGGSANEQTPVSACVQGLSDGSGIPASKLQVSCNSDASKLQLPKGTERKGTERNGSNRFVVLSMPKIRAMR